MVTPGGSALRNCSWQCSRDHLGAEGWTWVDGVQGKKVLAWPSVVEDLFSSFITGHFVGGVKGPLAKPAAGQEGLSSRRVAWSWGAERPNLLGQGRCARQDSVLGAQGQWRAMTLRLKLAAFSWWQLGSCTAGASWQCQGLGLVLEQGKKRTGTQLILFAIRAVSKP